VKRPPHTLAGPAAAAAALLAIAASGCGQRHEADLANGKALFVQKCGSCHKLARANTQGIQGPSLDVAFRQALRDGMNRKTVRGIVRDQISNVRSRSIMPRNLVTGNNRFDVASYVAFATGKSGQDQGDLAQAGKPKTSNKAAVEKNGSLEIDADPTGALAFTVSKATARPGKVTFLMKNQASIQHDISVKGDGKGPVVGKGGTSRFTTTLKPGKYEFLCTVPGHEAGGMKGLLTVK
jgi:plastocyanin